MGAHEACMREIRYENKFWLENYKRLDILGAPPESNQCSSLMCLFYIIYTFHSILKTNNLPVPLNFPPNPLPVPVSDPAVPQM